MSLTTRILHSTGFRLMLVYAACFSLSAVLLGVVMFYRMEDSMEAQIRSHVSHETSRLMVDYEQDGLQELLHDIRERRDLRDTDKLLYALRRGDGRVLFDKEIALPDAQEGWHRTQGDTATLIRVTPLREGYQLFVGERLKAVAELRTLLRNNVLLFLAGTLLLSMAGGIVMTRRFLARVDHITRATQSVGRHSLSTRLPVSPAQDDFDQLATTINAMLERIETLVDEIRHVTHCVAHDLRTPLARVRQELEVLAEDEPRSRVKAEAVIAMLDDTLQTFASMLQIAELEAGATRQDFTPVNLRELTENLYQTYLPAAEECGQRMRLICEGEPVVQGSRSLLTQLLVNLLENAIRHSGAGSEIVLQAEEARDGTVLLSVRDNGRGVSEEEAQQLLKPFFRADRSRSTSGSGLGLSLVQAIASLHGATVSLQRLPVGLMIQLRFARG